MEIRNLVLTPTYGKATNNINRKTKRQYKQINLRETNRKLDRETSRSADRTIL